MYVESDVGWLVTMPCGLLVCFCFGVIGLDVVFSLCCFHCFCLVGALKLCTFVLKVF